MTTIKETSITQRRWLGFIVVSMLAAIAAFAAACGTDKPAVKNEMSNKQTAANTNAATVQASNVQNVADKVPQPLRDAGELGENIYDAANTGDWAAAEAKLNELKATEKKLVDEKMSNAELGSTIAKLEKAVAAKDKTAALAASNQVTLIVAELTAKYDPAVPVEVVKLDYYGRELEIWAAAKNDAKLKETAKLIRQNWDAVKGKIAASASDKAAAFESLVKKVESAKTPAEFGKLATPILDEVDNLEQAFN